jgi:N-acetylmuramoyl-L-alanine amidase
MKILYVALLVMLVLAQPAALGETIETQAPAVESAVEKEIQAQPAEDAPEPVWDDTIQQGAGSRDAAEGTDAVDPDAAPAPVPSVVMKLVEEAKPLAGIKIGIDPGHQAKGNNQKETVAPNSKKTKPKVSSGTSGVKTHIPEYKTVLEISLKLREALELKGAEVYMTRETHDVNISNQERAKMMNGYGVDLVLRIHCDGVDNHSKHGIALYCSRSNSIAAESYRACEAILPAVCEATGAKNNGIVSNDNYTGQNWSTVPCLMVECGFASNPDEDVLLNSEDYQWLLAKGLTQGIIDYIHARDGE